jgi:hypothetical protein
VGFGNTVKLQNKRQKKKKEKQNSSNKNREYLNHSIEHFHDDHEFEIMG